MTKGVLLTTPPKGVPFQFEVTSPFCASRSTSRSMEKMPMSAPTPCRIWLVMVSEPAYEAVNLTSSPCSRFHFAAKPGSTALSITSFITEKA
jgi:hypothetical protein